MTPRRELARASCALLVALGCVRSSHHADGAHADAEPGSGPAASTSEPESTAAPGAHDGAPKASAAPVASDGEPASAALVFSEGERRTLSLLGEMCLPAVVAAGEGFAEAGVRLGCACCPPFAECLPQPDTQPRRVSPTQVFELRHWHEGSWTGPAQTQLAAVFEGCEPGSHGRGGTMIYDRTQQGLRVVRYASGVNPDSCQVLSGNGKRDQLVCQRTAGMGSTNYTSIELVDLASDPAQSDEIVRLDADVACLLDLEPYVIVRIRDMRLEDVDRDGDTDVMVEVASQSGTLTAQHLATCTRDDIAVPTNLPPAQHETFVFLDNNGRFAPNPATRKRLVAHYRARDAHRAPPLGADETGGW